MIEFHRMDVKWYLLLKDVGEFIGYFQLAIFIYSLSERDQQLSIF